MIPALIADRSITLPSNIAGLLNDVTHEIASLDSSRGATLGALGGLLLRTESVASSKIERITSSMDDYARAMHGSRANSSALSMVAATAATEQLMSTVTLTQEITLPALLDAHYRLMHDDELEHHYAGKLRDVQNWVGGSDYSPHGVLLVPAPPALVPEFMKDLLIFSNRRDLPSPLQVAIAHAQFETLHPFTDGNGRIGRAFINAIFRVRRTTTQVVIPLASALVAQRDAYFAALNAYRNGDIEPIVLSIANAAQIAAQESIATANHLEQLPSLWRSQLGRVRTGGSTDKVLQLLMTNPVLAAVDVEQRLGGSTSGAYATISTLVEAEILRPLTTRVRNQVWGASAMLDELDDLTARIEAKARDQ